jgi:hypothetical protein
MYARNREWKQKIIMKENGKYEYKYYKLASHSKRAISI